MGVIVKRIISHLAPADRLPLLLLGGAAAVLFLLHAALTDGAGVAAGPAVLPGWVPGDLAAATCPPGGSEGGQGVAVLLFHAVEGGEGAKGGTGSVSPLPGGAGGAAARSASSLNGNVIALDELENTFFLLKVCGYHPISLEEFHSFLQGREEVPPKAVLITFDDGYTDVYEKVLPLTSKYNFPAVVFTVSKWFDPYPRPEESRRHLSCEEARELLSSGLWQIGGHGYEGHRLVAGAAGRQGPFYVTRAWLAAEGRTETDAEYRARVWSDLVLERAALARAGVQELRDFAFPYGAFNADLVGMLKEAGYTYLYTNKPGLNRAGQDPSYIYRITASPRSWETLAELAWLFARDRMPVGY